MTAEQPIQPPRQGPPIPNPTPYPTEVGGQAQSQPGGQAGAMSSVFVERPQRSNGTHLDEPFPSTLKHDGPKSELYLNRLAAVQSDWEWRRKHVDLERAEKLFERYADDPTADGAESTDGIPRTNMTRSAVEDYQAVAVQNIPKARLIAVRSYADVINPIHQEILREVTEQSERVANAFVKTVLTDSQYDDEAEAVVKQAAIFGYSALQIGIDRSMDARASAEVRTLMRKARWTESDAKRYAALSKRIAVRRVPSKEILLQSGRRRHDENMLRVTRVEQAGVGALRAQYDNQNIKSGKFPYFIEEDPENKGNVAAKITTWEMEPVTVVRRFWMDPEDPSAGHYDARFSAWQILKTVIAGGEMVERELSDPVHGEQSLPFVMFYLSESTVHPYGHSIPLRLALHEEFVNVMRVIVYKSAKNAVSAQGVAIDGTRVSKTSLNRLATVLEDGGLAVIESDDSEPLDLKDVVMPLAYNASALSPAALQAMQNEEAVFQRYARTLDIDAVNRAESGAAKRATVQASDRPKSLGVGLLSTAVEQVYDRVYELAGLHHASESDIPIHQTNGNREMVRVNQRVQDRIPKMDEQGQVFADPNLVSDQNPVGLVEEDIEYTVNDLTINMRAMADGRGALPTDPTARFNQAFMWLQSQAILPETFRELALDDEIRELDDRMREARAKEEAEAAKRQQGQALMQGGLEQKMAAAQAGQNPGGQALPQNGPPDAQRVLGADPGMSPTPGEVAGDQQAMAQTARQQL